MPKPPHTPDQLLFAAQCLLRADPHANRENACELVRAALRKLETELEAPRPRQFYRDPAPRGFWQTFFTPDVDCWRILKSNSEPLLASLVLIGTIAGAFIAILAFTATP